MERSSKQSVVKFTRQSKGVGVNRWVLAVRKVVWITGFCVRARSYIKKSDVANWSFLQMKLNVENDLEISLNKVSLGDKDQHDAALSKKNRELQRLRMCTKIVPRHRTKKEVKEIYESLRSLQAMQEFPVEVQYSICRNVHWQQYKARQVIYREGGPMDSFYIILDGVVLLNMMHENENYDPNSPNELNRRQRFPVTIEELSVGQSFGNDTEDHKRKHTVVCKTSVIVLLLDNDSYSRIIKEPFRLKRKEDITLLQKLRLFANYPVQDLYDCDPFALYSKYYTKGSIIVDDISGDDSFYIVKSGKCRVLMSLDDRDSRESEGPDLFESMVNSKDDPMKVKEIFPLYHDKVVRSVRDKHTASYMFAQTDDFRADISSHLSENPIKLNSIPDRNRSLDHNPAQQTRRRRSSNVNLPASIARRFDSLASHSAFGDPTKLLKDRFVRTEYEPPPDEAKWTSSRLDREAEKGEEESDGRAGVSSSYVISMARRRASQKQRKARKAPVLHKLPSVAEAETEAPVERERDDSETNSPRLQPDGFKAGGQRKPKMVQVAALERGSIFGLESLVHVIPQPLSLVSDGCECIHFSKRHFLRTSSSHVIHDLTKLIIVFPNPEYCSSQVQRSQEWIQYKTKVMADLYVDTIRRKQLSKLRPD